MNIYEKHPHMDAYRVRDSFEPYAVLATDKRLSDAELAAMYWMSSSRKERMLAYADGLGSATLGQAHDEWDRMELISRFASLPHFDEVPA